MDARVPVARPPCYELFFAPLELILSPGDRERVHFAYHVSKYGHMGQKRDDGSRYFDHPKAAAWIYIDELGGRDPRAIIVLLLHDISEDSDIMSAYRITHNFGTEIASDLRAVTKLPKGKETTEHYLRRVIYAGPWAILAKLCDRLHNVRCLHSITAEKRQRLIAETREYHLPLLIPALAKYGGEWVRYAESLNQKLEEALAEAERA